METAWAVGFNAMSLTAEEENLLPPGANEAIYCQVPLLSVHSGPATTCSPVLSGRSRAPHTCKRMMALLMMWPARRCATTSSRDGAQTSPSALLHLCWPAARPLPHAVHMHACMHAAATQVGSFCT